MLTKIADGQGEVWEKARVMIGGSNTLALLLVKAALNNTSETPDFKETAELMKMSESGIRRKVENMGFRAMNSE